MKPVSAISPRRSNTPPGTIYLYYKEKDDIFHALHQEGFRKLIAMMEPLQFVADPFERLKAMGLIYMDFAKNNKDFYDLMFIMQAPMNMEKPDCWRRRPSTRTPETSIERLPGRRQIPRQGYRRSLILYLVNHARYGGIILPGEMPGL